MDLTGQVVLITGGSRGLGRAFAQALVAAGARVAITARSALELHETAAQLSSAANQAIAIPPTWSTRRLHPWLWPWSNSA